MLTSRAIAGKNQLYVPAENVQMELVCLRKCLACCDEQRMLEKRRAKELERRLEYLECEEKKGELKLKEETEARLAAQRELREEKQTSKDMSIEWGRLNERNYLLEHGGAAYLPAEAHKSVVEELALCSKQLLRANSEGQGLRHRLTGMAEAKKVAEQAFAQQKNIVACYSSLIQQQQASVAQANASRDEAIARHAAGKREQQAYYATSK